MQHHMTPYTQGMEPWAWWGDAFTNDELNFLQEKAKAASLQAGVGGTRDNLKFDVRRSQVDWLDNTTNTKWIFERLAHIGANLNASYFRLQLSGFGEPLQLTNYDQAENGMYGWHLDCGGNVSVSRKLSMAVQLSDPSEYEGGELQIFTGSQPQSIPKKRGLIAVFPSFTLHQVTPVTKGSRQSLVAWISGEPFK